MFGKLSDKFCSIFSGLYTKKLTEENIKEASKEVRLALLDADVNYEVVSTLIKRIKEKSLGEEAIKTVKPGEQFVKIVHDELALLMGDGEAELDLKKSPSVVMVCGLQGSGKTTQTAKLARFLKKSGKRVLLAACDLQRPAAVEQLKILGQEVETEVFFKEGEKDPRRVAKEAKIRAERDNFDVLIVDTAGRLHISEDLMQELVDLKNILSPSELLFVATASIGQEAAKIALEFDKQIGITGSILTMLDGSARAGGAISIKEMTKKPLKFEGFGEKMDDLRLFNPTSMADRILGMGDIINLVKKAQENIDEKEGLELEHKLKKASFTYADFLNQMKMMKKLGSFKGIMGMMPGFSSMGDLDVPEKEFKKIEGMIFSMTPEEREERVELSHPRKKRIALGSASKVDDVNRMVKNFKRIKETFKHFSDKKLKNMLPGMEDMKKQLGGNLWR